MAQIKIKPYFVLALGFIFLLHLFESFQLVHGVTKKPYLTKEEHMRISKYLRDEIKKKYPTDEEDDGELLTQEKEGITTVYKLVKEQEECTENKVIFRSAGKKEIGKEVVVLMRGQDYFGPMNKERFVVLRQKGGGTEYSTHLATVKRDSKNKMMVTWDTVSITVTKDASPLIEISSKPLLLIPTNWGNKKIPRCAWTGNVLLCEARNEPRKIGVKRAKKPKRRKPKPPYGRLPTPMPPFPPPPKKAGRPKNKNPFGIGQEGGPPAGGVSALGQEPLPGVGGPGLEAPGQGKPVLGGPGQEKGLGGKPVLGGPGQDKGTGGKPVLGGPGQDKGPGGKPVLGGPGQDKTKPGQKKPNKPGAAEMRGGGDDESSEEETFVKKNGSIHTEKKEKKGK